MKKFLILFITLISYLGFSQTTSEIFDYKVMTFYGLDFTSARCIGITEFPASNEMINFYFQEWNDLFMDQDNKYKIGKPYKKKKVDYDTMVFALNREINPDKLIIDKSYTLKKSEINDITKKYAKADKTGIGMVYIVEALNANAEYLSIWITFFQNSTGKVLLTEPLRRKGKGRRFGDYWEKAFIKLYMDSAYDYKAWSKIYK